MVLGYIHRILTTKGIQAFRAEGFLFRAPLPPAFRGVGCSKNRRMTFRNVLYGDI